MLVVRKPNKPANYEVPEINAELVEYHYNRTKHKGQWVFSKYMGMLMIDKMMSMIFKQMIEIKCQI